MREASPEKMRLELRAKDSKVKEGSMCQGPVAGGSREPEGLKKPVCLKCRVRTARVR